MGNLAATLRPAPHLRAALQLLHGADNTIPLSVALDDALAVEGLADMLRRATKASMRDDGTIDHNLQAAHVLAALRKGTP